MGVRCKAISLLACTVLAASVFAYVRERSQRLVVPHSWEQSGFEIGGHECQYSVADGEIEYILAFDRVYFRGAPFFSSGTAGYAFDLPNGVKFKMERTAPGRINIDGTGYDLQDGRIFFITPGNPKQACRQYRSSFSNCGRLTEKWKECVRANLTLARAGLPELDALLQPVP